MVHIKRVELSHFKSFGGTTSIPFLPGFTVISGPNGSGKSNILDALLFCLGLATSKGMRAERLPDLVNHNHTNGRKTTEASVSVTFDLSDVSGEDDTNKTEPLTEWTITRRLRVTQGGNYSSTYYINNQPCTVNELHEQLNRFRIYPEGYNVVLQGDVTRIITMNSRERREIIDELAGVAEFDRKIDKTKETLESVREREERCRIIEQELKRSLDRLASDRVKAEKYKKLKAEIQEKQQWEIVLQVRLLQTQHQQLESQISNGDTQITQFQTQLDTLNTQIEQTTTTLNQLNTQVKALGEEEQLSVASQLATQKAKRHQLQLQQQQIETIIQQHHTNQDQTKIDLQQYQQSLSEIIDQKTQLNTETIPHLMGQRDHTRNTLEQTKTKSLQIATASEAWVQEQTSLSHKIGELQDTLNPYRTEQAQLTERHQRLQKTIDEQTPRLESTETELTSKKIELTGLTETLTITQEEIKTLAQQLTLAEHDRTIQQDTQKRLLKEQRDKQRELDKLEATQQAQQEAQGTYATQIIVQSDLPGVCGIVANLGEVDPQFQLALEIAAGGRLGHIVVEDDSIASAGIALLKQKRVGRATFLPLNKIYSPKLPDISNLRFAKGFIDLAVNLINCHPRYNTIFAYVFGNTIVFETIDEARHYLGKYRIVTLDGDLLELSGAMTGGSKPSRGSIRFGTVSTKDSEDIETLKRRLSDIDQMLTRTEELIAQKTEIVNNLSQNLTEARQKERELFLQSKQLQKDIDRLTGQKEELTLSLSQNNQELETVTRRLEELTQHIPSLEAQLQQAQRQLIELEASQTHSEWLEIQAHIKAQETQLQQQEHTLRQAEETLKDLETQTQRLEEKITESQQRLESLQNQTFTINHQEAELKQQILNSDQIIAETEILLHQLTEKLGETKKERDRTETSLRALQTQHQQTAWNLEKLLQTQQERKVTLESLKNQLETQRLELPDPIPELPEFILNQENLSQYLEQLQTDIKNGQKRLEGMEPVNMLALEEYERTKERLDELSEKLSTLEAERTELLLRIENFTTLRFRAFKEAFDAVNENFQSIFATLSDGDGYLQLDNNEDPFSGGLNLVAHPKGKPVQRLSSMSGGEKSLTALSFIFALQRYRPSPFYAFDEVDMFLDGANVERLSKMIRQHSEQAQFIVVSLRRPMIEAAQRTIGVTQARGAHTQVLGIKL
ncbi:chromosome segregation protein SMC [Gloeothece citriformis PCC 7424]|uniref:Chromosome partition protein Smc n=1 Tax=Gloeothece citriformis (strain PCC 7424) TaxID=65393 RepID=B7K924_GLOC7|nr:chromosome segregation protein SMC [Gloeothece citriformis]ACK72793.1 chromosome segregation protein SMC [Gloeothece citriformis PCC 7424]